MRSTVLLFFICFGAASSSAAMTSFILVAMVGEINRKKEEREQISYFRFSWPKIWREYGVLYPDGLYKRALVIATVLTGLFALVTFYILFGVLSKYALPSR